MRRPRPRRRVVSPRAPHPRRAAPRISRAGLWRALLIMVWAGTFATIAYGLHRLEPRSRAANAEFRARLHWIDLPLWLADPAQRAVLADIERAADLLPDDDIYAPRLCERIATGLAESPWVTTVQRVSKQPDGLVHVQASFRKPVALVVWNGIGHLVADDGARLPGVKRAGFIGPEDGLVVTGVQAPAPRVGQTWEGSDLAAGLHLVDYLNRAALSGRLACKASLRAVDVAEFDPPGGPLRIKTIHPDSYIYWGLPPGEEYDIQPTAERKLAMLATLYARERQIPDAAEIDLRDPDRIGIRGRH